MEMITAKEYANKIKKLDLEELIEERKKLLFSIEYFEKNSMKKTEEGKYIYIKRLEYLVELTKIIKNKSDKYYLNTEKNYLHNGDIVKIKDKEYKTVIIADQQTGIKRLKDTVEIHVLPKYEKDYRYIRRAFNKYKKEIEQFI